MIAEFEEKQYEGLLNLELLQDNKLLFPPGQVLENTVGFDVALFTEHPKFWRNFPCHYKWYHRILHNAPSGISLPIELWHEINQNIENYPKFKFNAFIQHKRPEYMKRSSASEWASWSSPYYRYKLMSHQQDALSKIDNAIGNKGVVVYACPVFYKASDLWKTVEKQKLIENSNFCKVSRLDGHKVFTYREAGQHGFAHSKSEKIESYVLLDILSELSRTEATESNRTYLSTLGKEIDFVMLESSYYSQQYRAMTKFMLPELEQMETASALVKIDVFRFLTRTQLFIGY